MEAIRANSDLDKADHKRWSDLKLTLSFLCLGIWPLRWPPLASTSGREDCTSGREEVKKAAGAEECGPECGINNTEIDKKGNFQK